jgi:mono/diheme cytochrome c family protein
MVLKKNTLFSVLFMLVSCSTNKTSENESVAPVIINGEQLYNSNCATCHRITGEGGISGAKDLRITQLDTTGIKAIIQNGKNAMMPFKEMLSNEEINAVVAYVQTLSTNKK